MSATISDLAAAIVLPRVARVLASDPAWRADFEALRDADLRVRRRQPEAGELGPATWTVDQAAEVLGVHPVTVRRWIAHDVLVAHRQGARGRWLVDPDSVRAWARSRSRQRTRTGVLPSR